MQFASVLRCTRPSLVGTFGGRVSVDKVIVWEGVGGQSYSVGGCRWTKL